MSNISIASFGPVYLDIHSHKFPFNNTIYIENELEIVGGDYTFIPGGSALFFSQICSSLGINSHVIGKTGNDSASQIINKLLSKKNINTHFKKDDNLHTNLSINLTNSERKILMFVLGNANQSLTEEDVKSALNELSDAIDYMYFGGVFKLLRKVLYDDIISVLKRKNIKIILDHGRITNVVTDEAREKIKNLVSQTDLYLPSKDEFLDLWEISSINEGLKMLSEKYPNIITVVKDGENGSLALQSGKLIKQKAFPVTTMSLVGAGDAFNAGFITSFTQHNDIKRAMEYGSATAALKISHETFPDRESVEKMIA